MKTIYKTSEENGRLEEITNYCDGNWVCLISPTAEEVKDVSQHFEIELQDMISALDEDERARVDADDDYTLSRSRKWPGRIWHCTNGHHFRRQKTKIYHYNLSAGDAVIGRLPQRQNQKILHIQKNAFYHSASISQCYLLFAIFAHVGALQRKN